MIFICIFRSVAQPIQHASRIICAKKIKLLSDELKITYLSCGSTDRQILNFFTFVCVKISLHNYDIHMLLFSSFFK